MSAGAPSLVVVRHGDAGDRSRFEGDDRDRPLSREGERQAELIAKRLVGLHPSALFTSAAARCRETLVPLSKETGLPLLDLPELAEGEPAEVALDALLERTGPTGPVVACSHGDVLDDMALALERRGAEKSGRSSIVKGASIEVRCADGKGPVSFTIAPPPEADD